MPNRAMNADASLKQEATQPKPGAGGASLSTKGAWTLLALLAYFVLATSIVMIERRELMQSVSDLETTHQLEERQISLNVALASAVLTVNENYFAPDVATTGPMLALELESVTTGLRKISPAFPVVTDDLAALEQHRRTLQSQPSRAAIAELRASLHQLNGKMIEVATELRERKRGLLATYRSTYERVTIEWIVLMVGGIGAFSGVTLLFFRRLVRDIETVRSRATDIVRGYRGEPLVVTRRDEMGGLMEAVNGMQTELRQRETQLELGRQQQFHKEKMAAVGSLAAAVAHEINNPLSAIVGVAEAIAQEQTERSCEHRGSACRPQMILEQARRVMSITRQISEFSVPQSPEPEFISLNALVRSTCGFVGFDRRFRRVAVVQTLEPELPAVLAVADHLVQVLMNLLINAADAIEEAGVTAPRIEVATCVSDGRVELDVIDNGIGIAPEIIDRVFEENFTTKPPGRGSGLGLALCRTVIHRDGGAIDMSSRLGEGTRVRVTLPIHNIAEMSE